MSRVALGVWMVSIALLAADGAHARSAAQDRASQTRTTPDDALRMLREGNERFAAGLTLRRDLREQVAATRSGQFPYAAVLGCIDSRVPPELVFDTGIGDVFATRTAGNYADAEILGGLEFATKVAGAHLIVVLGHTGCGAVKGACDGVELGHLTGTLSQLAPALEASAQVPGAHDSSNAAYVRHVTEANAKLTAARLASESPILRALVEAGQLRIVAAIYDVATGRVAFLE